MRNATRLVPYLFSLTNAMPEHFFSRLRFSLAFLLFAISLSGCATFLGNDLPAYTFADLPPAPPLEKRACLIVTYKDCDKACHELNDPISEMLEKSGFFRRDCSSNADEKNNLHMAELTDLKVAYYPLALLSVGISELTLGIIPGYARDNVTSRIQLKKNEQIIKEYVYHEHADFWIHLSMLFLRSAHNELATTKKYRARLYMNFLHDFSRDFNNGMYDPYKITTPAEVSASK